MPTLKYTNGTVNPRFGSWNLQKPQSRDQYQFQPKRRIETFAILWITASGMGNTYRDAWNMNGNNFRATIGSFVTKLNSIGLQVVQNMGAKSVDLRSYDDLNKIEPTMKQFPGKPTLLLVVIPQADDRIYNWTKHLFDVKLGVVNVHAVGSKISNQRGQDQYFANVALKVNLKLGGRNHTLEDSKLGMIAQGKTMVVGLDVTHPSPGSSSNAPSVAGIVASIDKTLGQFPADIRIQTGRQEMVADLDTLLRSRLQLWKMHNANALPENILVYRDGVSEGQFDIVRDEELRLLKKACAAVYGEPLRAKGLPRLTIIIVGKRHHTRFYPTDTNSLSARDGNPQNGTVVDRQVTEARTWDFYLQAHTAIKGTARPAHYTVVHDEIFAHHVPPGFAHAADALEDLTHNLCYLYGRATKAVSICPPAYYADLVCERARRYLSRLFDATPAPSTIGSSQDGGAQPAADPNEVRIHDGVRDTMFYI